ncbi:hypothetical protein QE152_g37341 [Popillia japonica]|uniref:Uncharacterized protein n=1 Tax=Popillia japonica TaxID=7064 RepID=A0AAW1IAJ2_POPJA
MASPPVSRDHCLNYSNHFSYGIENDATYTHTVLSQTKTRYNISLVLNTGFLTVLKATYPNANTLIPFRSSSVYWRKFRPGLFDLRCRKGNQCH